ncbi:MAG: hypothetical protein ACK4E7_14425 [Permianibacter sp.]
MTQLSYTSRTEFKDYALHLAEQLERGAKLCTERTGVEYRIPAQLRFVTVAHSLIAPTLISKAKNRVDLTVVAVLDPKSKENSQMVSVPNRVEQLGGMLHEWTELNLAYRPEKAFPKKVEYWLYGNGSRWFREGIAEYCAHLLATEVLIESSQQLNMPASLAIFSLGEGLLNWSQSDGLFSNSRYSASFSVVKQLAELGRLKPAITKLRDRDFVSGKDIIAALNGANVDVYDLLRIPFYQYIDAEFLSPLPVDIGMVHRLTFKCKSEPICGNIVGELLGVDGMAFTSFGGLERYLQTLPEAGAVLCEVLDTEGIVRHFHLPLHRIVQPRNLPVWLSLNALG